MIRAFYLRWVLGRPWLFVAFFLAVGAFFGSFLPDFELGAGWQVLDVLALVADVRRDEPDAIGSYVISMTHAVSDLLEMLVLMREVGAVAPWQRRRSRERPRRDAVV